MSAMVGTRGWWKMALLLVSVVMVASGCAGGASKEAAASTPSYASALDTSFEGALDAESQLALGLLQLEDTANAVTEDQAVTLLPLWTALQEGVAQTTAEQGAVLRQIEGALTESQLSAIRAMQLTEEDGQAWLQERGGSFAPGGSIPGAAAGSGTAPGGRQGGMGTPPEGAGPSDSDRAAMREQFESMTEEERAQMRESFAQQAPVAEAQASGFSSGLSSLFERAVISLLSERSGQATVPELEAGGPSSGGSEPASEPTPEPTRAATPEPQAESTPEPEEVAAEVTIQPVVSENPGPTTAAESAASSSSATVVASPALNQVPDTDPGPPLTVEVTTNYAESNPNYEGGLIYHVAGFLHNPTDEFYAVMAVNVTFYDASGFRGAFYPFPQRRYGEYIRHGAVQADVGCTVLGPGESCPFAVDIGAQDMASFLIHPDAEIAEWHVFAAVTLSDVKVSDTGTSYVRISGTVINPNPYPVKNVSVAGVLLDASGQMVSMGTGVVASIATEGSASFEVYIPWEAYASYALYPTAEQDAK